MQGATSLLALLLFQSSNSGSPMLLLVVALAVVGAIADWNYHKAGGKPSSRRDRTIFWVIALAVVGAIALTEISGWDPFGILGYVTVPLAAWLFLAWEIGRWRMRRKHPIPKQESSRVDNARLRQDSIPEYDDRIHGYYSWLPQRSSAAPRAGCLPPSSASLVCDLPACLAFIARHKRGDTHSVAGVRWRSVESRIALPALLQQLLAGERIDKSLLG
jgi:hypothetical protein